MPRRAVPDPIAQKVGARIRELRRQLGINQEKLAYECGLRSKGHLSGIEKGLVSPTLQTLDLIAGRLEVDLLDLLTFPDTSPRQALVDATRTLPKGTVKKMLREVKAG